MIVRALAVAVATALLVALPAFAQRGTPPKWWQSEPYKTDLGLTAQQSKELEDTFQATMPRLRAAKEALDQAQRILSRTIAEATADESVVVQQINQVEGARSELGRVRGLMLFRMQRILTPEQRVKMNERFGDKDRRSKERR